MNLTEISNALPHGWTIQIDLQKGSRGVTLFGPCDDMYEPDSGSGIDADIEATVRFANFRDAEQDLSVSGAWGRFLKAVKK